MLLPLLLLVVGPVLGPTGCNDEPECHINATFTGALSGPGGWEPTGRDHCGFANTEALAPGTSAFVFIADQGDDVSLYAMLEQPSIAEGTHPGRMVYTSGEDIWASLPGTCSVELTEFVLEEWSQTDFIRFQGAVECPDPLVPVPPNNGELTISEVVFGGHIHAEVLTYPFP